MRNGITLDWQRVWGALALAIILTACSSGTDAPDPSGLQAIIGDEDFIPLDSGDPLRDQIGRIAGSGFHCMGFLVERARIMTAEHCVTSSDGTLLADVTFTTANGEVAWVDALQERFDGKDVVIVGIAPEIGQALPLSPDVGPRVRVFGFADELADSLQQSEGTIGEPLDAASGLLTYDADTLPGYSGSPVLNDENEVVAIHIGYSRDRHRNLIYPLSSLQDPALRIAAYDGVLSPERNHGPYYTNTDCVAAAKFRYRCGWDAVRWKPRYCTGNDPVVRGRCTYRRNMMRHYHLKFNAHGANAGEDCEQLHEHSDPQGRWSRAHLCSNIPIGMRWSSAGPVAGMRCTQVVEPAEPAHTTWTDNYLCLSRDEYLNFKWSYDGPVAGLRCVRWHNPRDPHTCTDNYLCY